MQMPKWFQNPMPVKPAPLDDKRRKIVARLADEEKRLTEIRASMRQQALAAVEGSQAAKGKYLRLNNEAGQQEIEIELLKLAIEAIEEQQVEEQRKAEEAKKAKAAAERKKALDAWEAELRPQYEATIERFERRGEKGQAMIWRKELENLRTNLEERVR